MPSLRMFGYITGVLKSGILSVRQLCGFYDSVRYFPAGCQDLETASFIKTDRTF